MFFLFYQARHVALFIFFQKILKPIENVHILSDQNETLQSILSALFIIIHTCKRRGKNIYTIIFLITNQILKSVVCISTSLI